MGTNYQPQIKPPLPPKPQREVDIPQKVLDSPESSTNTSTGTQYRPIPKPRLHKPGPPKHTLNQAGNADQEDMCYVDTAASSIIFACDIFIIFACRFVYQLMIHFFI